MALDSICFSRPSHLLILLGFCHNQKHRQICIHRINSLMVRRLNQRRKTKARSVHRIHTLISSRIYNRFINHDSNCIPYSLHFYNFQMSFVAIQMQVNIFPCGFSQYIFTAKCFGMCVFMNELFCWIKE